MHSAYVLLFISGPINKFGQHLDDQNRSPMGWVWYIGKDITKKKMKILIKILRLTIKRYNQKFLELWNQNYLKEANNEQCSESEKNCAKLGNTLTIMFKFQKKKNQKRVIVSTLCQGREPRI